jgi:hypothetical protein
MMCENRVDVITNVPCLEDYIGGGERYERGDEK